MHTRCCEELIGYRFGGIGASGTNGNRLEIDTTNIETVPAIIEVKFDMVTPPAAGNVLVFNSLWTGNGVISGTPRGALSLADVLLALNLGISAGFFIEYPGGIGRGVTIVNSLDTAISGGFVSIRKLSTLTEDSSTVRNSRG